MESKHQPKTLSSDLVNFIPNFALPSTVASIQHVKYFDRSGICRIAPIDEAIKLGIRGITKLSDSRYRCLPKNSPMIKPEGNTSLFLSAVSRLKAGDSWSYFMEICNTITRNSNAETHREWLDRYLGIIHTPQICFHGEGKREDMFDYIRVHICLTEIVDNHKKAVHEHFDEITKIVLDKIDNHRYFHRFGIPVSELTVASAVITPQKVLIMEFEPKTT